MRHRRQTLFLAVLLPSIASSAAAQAPGNSTGRDAAPGLRKLTGDDEKRAKELDEQSQNALKADRWDEAIVKTQDTALLMTRFYQNMLGKRPGLSKPMPKAAALGEAKRWLRGLTTKEADAAETELSQVSRGDVRRRVDSPVAQHPFEHPHFWAAFVLVGDPD
jgi:hypothetical protein